MASKIYLDGDDYGNDYEPSDSEEEYTEYDRNLLKKVRQKRQQIDDEKEEVLRFDDTESEEDGNDLVDNSDFEEQEDDGIPDSKAWGRKKSAYYNTDFVDPDYSTYNEKEEELARQEEEDAKAIQLRLAKELNEADFTLDVFTETTNEKFEDEPTTDVLKVDLSNLPIRQRQQLFQKDSPEFSGLVQDFEQHMNESESLLKPVIEYASENSLKAPVIEFARLQNNLILTYCTNISFYLLLKAKRIPVKNHPVVKRLVQLKQLLDKLDEKYEQFVKPQLQALLEAVANGVDVMSSLTRPPKPSQKKLKMMQQFEERGDNEVESGFSSNDEAVLHEEIPAQSEEGGSEMEIEEQDEDDDDERRGITYQIAKNKGLTPHRKKELRNPRVKHRNKYRKALVRRKGAVRTARKELKRYGGEISGIKATVKKGVKIKS